MKTLTAGKRGALVISSFIIFAIGTAAVFGFKISTMLIYASIPIVALAAYWAGN